MSYEKKMEQDYSHPNLGYKPRKVSVLGANGKNGLETLLEIMKMGGVDELVGIVRDDEKVEKVYTELRKRRESTWKHKRLPLITADIREIKWSQVVMDWTGMNLATLEKNYPNFRDEAKKMGRHPRDMLLEYNLPIALSNAKNVKLYAPNSIVCVEGNPCDVLAWVWNKSGLNAITSGTMMETYRLGKFVTDNLGIQLSTGYYVGEHGEFAVPIKSSFRVGVAGIPLETIVMDKYGQKGIDKLNGFYQLVNDEAHWLVERTGETPFVGPSGVARDLVNSIINSDYDVVTSLGIYIPNKDIVSSRPVYLSNDGARLVENVKFTQNEIHALKLADSHIKEMCTIADKLVKEKGLYTL